MYSNKIELRRYEVLKGIEWIYFLLCVAFCVYAFIDKEYVFGVIFTIFTVIGTINSIKANLKDRKTK